MSTDGQRRLKELFKELQAQNWQIEYTKKHVHVRSPEGQLFTCSNSPRCPFAADNLRRDIRKYRRVK